MNRPDQPQSTPHTTPPRNHPRQQDGPTPGHDILDIWGHHSNERLRHAFVTPRTTTTQETPQPVIGGGRSETLIPPTAFQVRPLPPPVVRQGRRGGVGRSSQREFELQVHQEDNIGLLLQTMDNILLTIPGVMRRRWLRNHLEIEERRVSNGRSSPLGSGLVNSPSQELFKPAINF